MICPHDEEDASVWVRDLIPQSVINELRRQHKRRGRTRQGCIPLRKRKKRLHKKLAKRGFSASPTIIIWSSNTPGYGTRGTKWDWAKR